MPCGAPHLYLPLLAPMPANLNVQDPASAANFHQLSVEHIALDWTVDFEASEVEGTATLEFARHAAAADIAEVVLDVFKLDIEAVELLGQECAFEVKDFTGFGAALVSVTRRRAGGAGTLTRGSAAAHPDRLRA